MQQSAIPAQREPTPTTAGALPHVRYETLDGFRGVAAIAIMLYHSRHYFLFGHVAGRGYLAVNFFFMLSGFVIAHAYERRLLNGLGFGDFIRARLGRLYPVYVLGGLFGLAAGLLVRQALFPGMPVSMLLWMAVLTAYCIPNLAGSANQNVFPLNPPYWSLFYELAANVFYAVIGVRLSDKALGRIMLAAGVGLVLCWFEWGKLTGGFAIGNFLAGAARIGFSFPLGVLLYRNHRDGKLARFKGSDGVFVLLLFAGILISPTGRTAEGVPALLDLAIIFLVLPLMAALAIEAKPASTKLHRSLGRLSYPLFAVHYPMFMLCAGLGQTLGLPAGPVMTVAVLASLGLAWLVAQWLEPNPRAAVAALFQRLRVSPRLAAG